MFYNLLYLLGTCCACVLIYTHLFQPKGQWKGGFWSLQPENRINTHDEYFLSGNTFSCKSFVVSNDYLIRTLAKLADDTGVNLCNLLKPENVT